MPLRLVPALLALLLFAPPGAAAAGLPVVKKVLTFNGRHTRISIEYPQTGNKVIDAALAAYAHENLTGADRDALQTLILYDIARNDDEMFAVTFSIGVNLGGAHPQPALETFDFLRPEGTRIFLSDIVDGQRGIDLISRLAIADLTRGLVADGDPVDAHWVSTGAGPQAENFDTFFVTPDALHVLFAPYMVGAYAEGTREAVIPLAQLKSVLRLDWRAPVASFDCGRSATAIERAICADAALARLDRRVSETYRSYLGVSSAPDKYRQWQRDWLALRNKSCPGAAPAPCLTKLYRARLGAFKKPPL